MRTVLVTGGAGFIGGCFVRRLVAGRSAHVVNLDKLTYAGNLDSLAAVLDDPLHTFVEGDIAEPSTLADVFDTYAPDAVVHLAGESHVDRSIDGPAEFVQTNVLGTFHLLNTALSFWRKLPAAARADWRFLHVSTDEVYGSLGSTGRFTEDTAYAPNSPYSASKAAADHFARAYHRTFGLPVLTTNCSNNYGPYQFPEKLIPLMVLNALEGKPLPLYGDGLNVRDWIFVEDHCEGVLTVLEKGRPGETYNLGGNAERTNLEVVRAVCRLVDELCPDTAHRPSSNLITFVDDRPGHDRRYAIDSSKVLNELGWRPQHDFDSGLRETVRWYLSNPQWIKRVATGVYRRERLGLSKTKVG